MRQYVKEVLPDAPGPEGLVVPPGYRLGEDGIYRYGRRIVEVTCTPILIVARIHGQDGETFLKIACRSSKGEKWRVTVAKREVALSPSRVISLASRGFPVASPLARSVAKYLSDFELANLDVLPVIWLTSRLGWQGDDGERGFLWGETAMVPPSAHEVVLDLNDALDSIGIREDINNITVCSPMEIEDAHIASGYHRKGTLEGWIRAVEPLKEYPSAVLGIYAACMPPLLEIIGTTNFIIHWSSPSTSGKTMILRVAASVWGNPDEYSMESAIWTWGTTAVTPKWLHRASVVLNGLPLILRDIDSVADRYVSKTLTMVAECRGQFDKKEIVWRTVLLSSGKKSIAGFIKEKMAQRCVLEIRKHPFGMNPFIDFGFGKRICNEIATNYGHVGPILVQWLIRHRDKWGEIRSLYLREYDRYKKDRRASIRCYAHLLSALRVAGYCLHQAMEEAGYSMPWPQRDFAIDLWSDLVLLSEEAPPDVLSLKYVVAWAYANEKTFYGRNEEGSPVKDLSGRWPGEDDWDYIAFYPHVLQRVLWEAGYSYDSTIRAWHKRGWLNSDPKRKTKYVCVGNSTSPMVVIRRSAIKNVL